MMFWIDLETTGLDAKKYPSAILEWAVATS